jgi:glutamine synthetase
MLLMDVIEEVANRHGLQALLHEKPFAGLNGSGKHLNWSLADNLGNNLLEPGTTPHENLKFILFLTAIVMGVDRHQDLLRAAIASAGNDHRLGANEAPPAIISIFVGSLLEEVIDSIIEGRPPRTDRGSKNVLRLGVSSLPDLPRDFSDRNRTSPFAFTGNKFEFRAVSSNQSVAYPAAMLNLIVAEAIDEVSDAIEKRGGPSTENIQAAVRDTLKKHRRILFDGDNYSDAWKKEAARRGLLNRTATPEALADFASDANVKLYERYGVFTRGEAESRYRVMHEMFVKKVNIEAIATRDIAMTMLLPASMTHQRRLAETIHAVLSVDTKADVAPQRELLTLVTTTVGKLKRACDNLLHVHEEVEHSPMDLAAHARAYHDRVRPAMDAVRVEADLLERLVDDDLWPLPKYREMLWIH